MWTVFGWLAWDLALAALYTQGCRTYARHTRGFPWATAARAFPCWIIALDFLVRPVSGLPVVWLLPAAIGGGPRLV